MKNYLKSNKDHWEKGYEADNVESQVFRTYGTIFRDDLGLDGAGGEKLLDYGCGQGAAVRFFGAQGFDVHGVDISEIDISRAKEKYPECADHFAVIDSEVRNEDVFFGGEFDIVTAIQSLYYLSDTDMQVRLRSLYDQMKPGAILYATMGGTQSYFFENSEPAVDGLRKVTVNWKRIKIRDYYVTFCSSEQDLIRKFHLFRPVHIGFYGARFRNDEGEFFYYNFVGRKEV